MEFLATNFLLDPFVAFLELVLHWLTGFTHNFGWSLIALAVLVKVVFWPLNSFQFKSIAKMQALQPRIKALQAKYKDKQQLQQETMALYKETGVNPFASCLPLLLQMPILYSVYFAINSNCADFAKTSFAWIGSAIAHLSPSMGTIANPCNHSEHLPAHLLATSLLFPDYLLLALYVVSMYFSVRLSSPAMDEQQAQTQKIMALVSPVMIAFIGRGWPSALILYWLAFNVLTMAQQAYLMRRYMRPATGTATAIGPAEGTDVVAARADGDASVAAPRKNGSPRGQRRRRGSRR